MNQNITESDSVLIRKKSKSDSESESKCESEDFRAKCDMNRF